MQEKDARAELVNWIEHLSANDKWCSSQQLIVDQEEQNGRFTYPVTRKMFSERRAILQSDIAHYKSLLAKLDIIQSAIDRQDSKSKGQ